VEHQTESSAEVEQPKSHPVGFGAEQDFAFDPSPKPDMMSAVYDTTDTSE